MPLLCAMERSRDRSFLCNISISPDIHSASPFCKGGLRGILLMQPEFIEKSYFFME